MNGGPARLNNDEIPKQKAKQFAGKSGPVQTFSGTSNCDSARHAMADGPKTDPSAATGAKEPSKADLAKAEFEAAIAEATASVEALMLKKDALSSGEKYRLCRSIGEECVQEQELYNLLDKKPEVIGTLSPVGLSQWLVGRADVSRHPSIPSYLSLYGIFSIRWSGSRPSTLCTNTRRGCTARSTCPPCCSPRVFSVSR